PRADGGGRGTARRPGRRDSGGPARGRRGRRPWAATTARTARRRRTGCRRSATVARCTSGGRDDSFRPGQGGARVTCVEQTLTEASMPYYRRVGIVPPKRHTQFRRPDGGLYAEELMGTDGFSSSSSLLYHRNPPTALIGAQPLAESDPGLAPNRPLLPRHLLTGKAVEPGDLVGGRVLLAANDDVRLSVAHADRPSPLY